MSNSLEERLETEQEIETVQLEPGDTLTGELVEQRVGSHAYGKSPIAIIRREDGSLARLWLIHHVLRSEFASVQPQIGETLGVKRLEDASEDAGEHGGYKRYRVVVDREQEEISWSEGPQPGSSSEGGFSDEELHGGDEMPF